MPAGTASTARTTATLGIRSVTGLETQRPELDMCAPAAKSQVAEQRRPGCIREVSRGNCAHLSVTQSRRSPVDSPRDRRPAALIEDLLHAITGHASEVAGVGYAVASGATLHTEERRGELPLIGSSGF